jgi:cysteine synthase B|tara:strand:- start:629 stop:1678 length:1050 start_codon:yes stop_codon:yes gene_type:complete
LQTQHPPEIENIEDIVNSVGKTPLVKLDKLFDKEKEIYAKIEWCNPSGSVKARPAAWMLNEGKEQGNLIRDKTTVIEPTSGNTGVALSHFAKSLGYKIELAVPERMSDETKDILKTNGAKLLETEDDLCPRVGPGTDQAIALASALIKNHPDEYYSPDQYNNDANFRSHYYGTGPEIWKATNGEVGAFITGIGTGGTITGVGTFLKEKNQNIKIIAAEPQKNHNIQGLRNLEESEKPELLKRRINVIDEKITVTDKESFEMIKKLLVTENLFAGPSTGSVLATLNKTIGELEGKIVLLFGDNAAKYKSIYSKFGVYSEKEFDTRLNESKNNCFTCTYSNDNPEDLCKIN